MVTPIDWASDVLPPRTAPWDLLVLGGGTAGIVAAKTAARLGEDVLLVERHRTGGDCLWTGCVPSKALLSRAHRPDATTLDFTTVMSEVHDAIATIEPVDSPQSLRDAGVVVVHGEGTFTGPASLEIGGEHVTFRHAVLATGSSPLVPDVPGLDQVQVVTSDSVWSLTIRPERLLVVGGGNIGCELGQAFARLGTEVTVIEAGPRILAREDADAAAVLHSALGADGIDVRTGVSLDRMESSEAVLSDGSRIPVTTVLLAVGRRPGTAGIGLDRAGVEVDDGGHVVLDPRLRTTNHRIWAAGDLTGHPALTHVAGVHGSQAATNAVLGLRRAVDLATIPRVTYTQPEVAAFGMGADRVGIDGVIERTVHHDEVDRAVAEDRTEGFSRLVLDRKGRVVGATIVGPRAGESLAEVVLAARHGLRARDLAASTHAYPTYGDGVWNASLAQLREDLTGPWARRAVRLLRALRRLFRRT
ncbi:FAD-dependent oxidoreductase [Cytobacillus oceanisediminis]